MAARACIHRLLRPSSARFCTSSAEAAPESAPPPGIGVPEFLKSIGKGVEAYVDKIQKELPDLEQLLLVRRMKLKKIGVPCKHRKQILRHTEKYRQNLWTPRITKA